MSKQLGDAFVRVRPNTDGFASEANSGISPGLKKVAGLIAGVFASGAIYKGASALVGRASDLNETVNKSNIIFGKNAGVISKWSKSSAQNLGLPQSAALDAAASFGDMFTQLGFTAGGAAKLSKSTVQMAADLGSFNNLKTEDVLDRISAAMRGEYDSLQAVIPNISAARVQQVAMAQSGKKNAEQLTAQEKAAATLSIINKDGARAMGDYSRTQDGFANSSKTVRAQVENLKTKIGTGLLPIWTSAANMLRTQVMPPLISFADEYVPKAAAAIGKWVSGIDLGAFFSKMGGWLANFDPSKLSLSGLGDGFRDIGESLKGIDWGSLKDALGQGVSDTISVFAVVIGFAADHVDDLAKVLPALIVAFVAYKAAQAASNVFAIAALPLQAAQIFSNIALASANRALATQMAITNGVEKVGLLTRIRSAVATAATAVAQTAASVASKAWAVTQWLLNAALTANPIGIVVVAIAALVGGLILAYKKSETFRNIVNGAFQIIKNVVGAVVGWLGSFVPAVFSRVVAVVRGAINAFRSVVVGAFNFVRSAIGNAMNAVKSVVSSVWHGVTTLISRGAQAIVDGVKSIPGKIVALASFFKDAGKKLIGAMVDGLKNAAGVIGGIAGNVWGAVKKLLNGGIDKINSALDFTIHLPGPDIHINPPNIPHLWTGARVDRPTLAVIGDGSEPESVMPDSMLQKALDKAAAGEPGGAGQHNEFHIYEQRDPDATAAAVERRLAFVGGS